MKWLAAALALAFCAHAQAMFKCKDPAGKITYSSEDCKKIGLVPAGPIKEGQVTVAPALKPKAAPVAAKAKPGKEKGEAPADYSEFREQLDKEKRKGDPSKPRCFIVQTPMGTTTKCVDKADQAELD